MHDSSRRDRRRAAGLAAGATAAVHLTLLPAHITVSYIGVAFVVSVAMSLALAASLWARDATPLVWGLGTALMGAMLLALVMSRTTGLPGVMGLPGYQEEGWGWAETASVFFELSFVVLATLEWRTTAGLKQAPRRNRAVELEDPGVSRRGALAALIPLVGAGATARLLGGPSLGVASTGAAERSPSAAGGGHKAKPGDNGSGATKGSGFTGFKSGDRVDYRANGFDPREILRDFDYGKTRRLADGRTLREWTLISQENEIEVAPGVKFAAWTYNGRIPGPTLRAREGDLLRVNFVNGASHPHTIHFHGIHSGVMDGVPGVGPGLIDPGERFTYEFTAEPGPSLGIYNCHASPLAAHIAKGLYGAFIVDPKEPLEKADELMMMMSGFDTNFDGANELYAVNGIPFAYAQDPIRVKRGELVRIYLGNMTEFDLINSMHIHGVYFNYYPTGTFRAPPEYTDTIIQGQGQRGVIEVRFEQAGMHMFHAHVSEFTDLGWMGFFEVVA